MDKKVFSVDKQDLRKVPSDERNALRMRGISLIYVSKLRKGVVAINFRLRFGLAKPLKS